MINQNFNYLTNNYTKHITSIYIHTNGNKKVLTKNDTKFNLIIENLNKTFANSRLMPAYGVSLHEETIKEIKKGVWLEINFDSELEINELLFTSLLFKLEPTYGLNIIRLYNNKYEGRCIHVDFMENVDLLNIIKTF